MLLLTWHSARMPCATLKTHDTHDERQILRTRIIFPPLVEFISVKLCEYAGKQENLEGAAKGDTGGAKVMSWGAQRA
eukprot:719592-Pleurochrysis_carterae.AAC.2